MCLTSTVLVNTAAAIDWVPEIGLKWAASQTCDLAYTLTVWIVHIINLFTGWTFSYSASSSCVVAFTCFRVEVQLVFWVGACFSVIAFILVQNAVAAEFFGPIPVYFVKRMCSIASKVICCSILAATFTIIRVRKTGITKLIISRTGVAARRSCISTGTTLSGIYLLTRRACSIIWATRVLV